MEPILRAKLAAGKITQFEYNHLMSVDAEAQAEEERGVYELSAKDLKELDPTEINGMMSKIKAGQLDVASAMCGLHGDRKGSTKVGPRSPVTASSGLEKKASFRMPGPPPPAGGATRLPTDVAPSGLEKKASFRLPGPPPLPPVDPGGSAPPPPPALVSPLRSAESAVAVARSELVTTATPAPTPHSPGSPTPRPRRSLGSSAVDPAATAALEAQLVQLQRENDHLRSRESEHERTSSVSTSPPGSSPTDTTSAGGSATKKGKGRKKRVLPQVPTGSRGSSRSASTSPGGLAASSTRRPAAEGRQHAAPPLTEVAVPPQSHGNLSDAPTETILESVSPSTSALRTPQPSPRLSRGGGSASQHRPALVTTTTVPEPGSPSGGSPSALPRSPRLSRGSGCAPQHHPAPVAPMRSSPGSPGRKPFGGVQVLAMDCVAELKAHEGSPPSKRMSARRSQDVGESGVAVDGGRGSIGRKSSFGKGVSSVPVETNGVPYVRKSGSEKRPPPVVARSSAGSVASLQSLSKGGWGALEETTAVDDQWQYQGADDDGASSAATEELADAGDDGDTDEDTMIAPENSSLQQRRRRPTKAGDETAGKTDYSIKQRNRRRDQVAQRLGVYSDDISEWLNELLKIDPPLVADTLMTSLETGVALCQLAHCVHKSIGSWRYPTSADSATLQPPHFTKMVRGPFQARDNVCNFITWVTELGVPCLFESEDLVLHKSDMAVLYCLMDVARGAVDCIDVLPHLVQFEQEIDSGITAVEVSAAESDDGEEAAVVATMNLRNEEEEMRAVVFLQEEAKRQAIALAAERAQEAARLEGERAAREEKQRLAAIEEERAAVAAMKALELEMRKAEEVAKEAARFVEAERLRAKAETEAVERARLLAVEEECRLSQLAAEKAERSRLDALEFERKEREAREQRLAQIRAEEERVRQAAAEAARLAAAEAARQEAEEEVQRQAELAAEEADRVRLAELEREAQAQKHLEDIERLKAEVVKAQEEARLAAARAEAMRCQRQAERLAAQQARIEAAEKERRLAEEEAAEAEQLRLEAEARERVEAEAREREAARIREEEERARLAKERAAVELARKREAAQREAVEAERLAAELERQRQESMLREMEEAKRKAAEAARRKLAAEKRARDDAETAARLRDEAAEAQRLAEAAAAAREAELKKLKEDEANSFWLQEAMRLEEEAARKRKKKAKAAVSKKDTIVPKDLQDRMFNVGIKPAGQGKYMLGKTSLNVRVYKEHLVVRVGGGWDTLENYLFDHFKTRPGLKGHVLIKDGSGVPKWEKAPEMAKYVADLEQATEDAVISVAKQLKDGEIKDDEVNVNASLALIGGSTTLNRISGFAKRPSQDHLDRSPRGRTLVGKASRTVKLSTSPDIA
eukprot:m.57792 g.57792  ORF g.57792 m.57792 type:complete len:1385 (+) comp17137_c0_seq1:245-4399(+)